MLDPYEAIEPALSWADESLRQASAAPESASPSLDDALRAIEACHGFVTLFRAPVFAEYDPRALIEACVDSHDERRVFEADPLPALVGDSESIAVCARALIDAVELYEDSFLVVRLTQDGDVPVVQLDLDGPGKVPARLLVGGELPLGLDVLDERWTIATRGGRIDRTSNGAVMRLRGLREPPSPGDLDDALPRLVSAARASIRAALAELDAGRPLAQPLGTARAAVAAVLALVDGPSPNREPADLSRIWAEALEAHKPLLDERAVAVESLLDAAVPPVPVVRRRILGFFRHALSHVERSVPRGGDLSMMMDYEPARRCANILLAVTGSQCDPSARLYPAAMRRAVEDVHQGRFESSIEDTGFTLSASLPDTIGAALDTWLPGWDAFSPRSQQMLRLLKSGGPTPPAEFLLDGILEEELERRLLPRLAAPAAVNLAHELEPGKDALPGASTERCAKALAQIRRGKARKEIAGPAYAAEIFWTFRRDERGRAAVGIAELSPDDIRTLCASLLQSPPDHLVCLRILARIPVGA